MTIENVNDKYVLLDGKLIPKSVLKEVRKGLMQDEQQEVTYELDNERIFYIMLEFDGALDGYR